ncbi:MAG: hypothetical protein J6Q58_00525, partial [Clostridia bacterium]|nr:hypothetical protein [Clostridia bacterium]
EKFEKGKITENQRKLMAYEKPEFGFDKKKYKAVFQRQGYVFHLFDNACDPLGVVCNFFG